MFSRTVTLVMLLSCGTVQTNKRVATNAGVERLRQQVFELAGTIAQINSFIASDFANCSTGLPAFEQKICEIAQTATAEQRVQFAGQLQTMVKTFQDELYGDDCINTVDVGCPVADSITDRLATLTSDFVDLANDVAAMSTDLWNMQSRLDDFNGSGNSIEIVIGGLEADIAALEAAVTEGDIYQTHFVCHDNANVGPIYEPVLFTGDQQKLYAYINTTTKNGMGVVAEAGVSGDQFLTTEAATRDCNFKVYDLIVSLKLCWRNDDRNASSGDVDTECDSAGGFANPTSNCTCEG